MVTITVIIVHSFSGILKSGEARLGKIIREKMLELFGDKTKDFEVILKDSSTTYTNGISK